MDHLDSAARRFAPDDAPLAIQEFGNGNINRTFLVSSRREAAKPFLLQRLNTHVFHRPDLVMANIGVITDHVKRHIGIGSTQAGRRWEIPSVLKTGDGHDHWRADDGSFWRAISFIEGSHTLDVVADAEHAREVGFALGTFHTLLSDLPPERLADTLPGFHVTPGYLNHHDEVMARGFAPRSAEERWCLDFIGQQRATATVLETARAQGRLLLRPIHGDPKVNNVLLDRDTDRALGLIDLDTVKPGLIQYDIGDCLRSSCNRRGEETTDWERVEFDPDLGRAVLEGYCAPARGFLTATDFDLMPDAIRLIAFELGLRFFTDHCEGDVYFKASRPGHNLARALVQLKLAENITGQTASIRAMIDGLR